MILHNPMKQQLATKFNWSLDNIFPNVGFKTNAHHEFILVLLVQINARISCVKLFELARTEYDVFLAASLNKEPR